MTSSDAPQQQAAPAPPPPPSATPPPCARRIDDWTPSGRLLDFCGLVSSSDAILAMGVVQNVPFLITSWERYVAEGSHDPERVSAFIQAFALCYRRCPSAVQPAVGQLIARTPELTADNCVRLAHLVADLGAKDEAYALISKATPVKGLTQAFYLCLLRLATESMTPPDMDLAVEVADRMSNAGMPHTAMSLRLILTGMSRMARPPIQAAIRIMNYKRELCPNSIEGCLAGTFFNVLDTAVGPDALVAGEYVRGLPMQVVHDPIKTVCLEPPCVNKAGCFEASCTRYWIVDPATVDLSGVMDVPEHTYLVFLYSTIRQLASRCNAVCSANPANRKLADIERLLSSNKQAVVVPYDSELKVRGQLPPSSVEPPSTPQDRLLIFARAIHMAASCSFQLTMLSNDANVIKGCAELNVPVQRGCFQASTAAAAAAGAGHNVSNGASRSASTAAAAGAAIAAGAIEAAFAAAPHVNS